MCEWKGGVRTKHEARREARVMCKKVGWGVGSHMQS